MWEAAIITIQAVTSCMPEFAWEHTQRMWEGAIIPFQTTINHEEFARLHIIQCCVNCLACNYELVIRIKMHLKMRNKLEECAPPNEFIHSCNIQETTKMQMKGLLCVTNFCIVGNAEYVTEGLVQWSQ